MWLLNSDGQFSVRSFYYALLDESVGVFGVVTSSSSTLSSIFFGRSSGRFRWPLRLGYFILKVFSRGLPTREALSSWSQWKCLLSHLQKRGGIHSVFVHRG